MGDAERAQVMAGEGELGNREIGVREHYLVKTKSSEQLFW